LANCARTKGEKDKEKQLRIISSEAPLNDAAELFFMSVDRWYVRDEFTAEYPEYTLERACRDFREMLRLEPNYYNALFYMPYRLSEENRNAEALIGWYACVAQRPDDAFAIINRGAIHGRLGQFDEAKADYELALSKHPDKPGVLSCVARNLATDPNEAMRDGRRAVELATKACNLTRYDDPACVDALALAYAETGDFVSAVKWSEMAVKVCDTWRREEIYMKHLDQFRAGKPWRED
jgi:tetratricopeptide (TPR) repeat protein